MACRACGRVNRPGARFCVGCGNELTVACGACGAELPADARFCDRCGAPVAAGASQPAPAAVAQVRKVVTVVFADLTGSTGMQEALDPESARRVMDELYAV